MEWLKNKWVQFYLWCHPKLKRVRLEVLAWSTEASVKPVSLYHDAMLSRGSGLSLYLLPLVMRSKQHLFNNRWTTTEAPVSVGRIFMDYVDWVYIEKDLHPENVYYDLVNRIEGNALLMAIEIGEENPEPLIKFIHANLAWLLHHPAKANSLITSFLLDHHTLMIQIFQAMYSIQTGRYNRLIVFRRDGILFILFDS